jgi:hypothetical protein
MEIPTVESLGSFQNYKFLEDCTKIPYFIDSKNSQVNRRHLYECCEKSNVQNRVEMRKKWIDKLAHPM